MVDLPETQEIRPILGLEKGEKIVWSGKPARKGYIGTYIGIIIFWLFFGGWAIFVGHVWFALVMFLIIVGIGALAIEIRVRAHKYFITNKRFMREFTFLRRHTEAAPMDLVTDINFGQGILQRIVNYGNVHILTAGTPTGVRGHPGFRFEAVHNPIDIAKIASGARTKYKK